MSDKKNYNFIEWIEKEIDFVEKLRKRIKAFKWYLDNINGRRTVDVRRKHFLIGRFDILNEDLFQKELDLRVLKIKKEREDLD